MAHRIQVYFSAHELSAIESALRVAADQYTTDAHSMDMANHPHMAEGFRAQAAEARKLADIFAQAERVWWETE